MIEPYQAIGLVLTIRGISRRHEIGWNVEHISHLIRAASWLSGLDLPVRLIAIPEGALQGFTDEVLDLDHDYSGGSSWVAAAIDIEALRRFRAGAQWDNWLEDLTTGQYQVIYDEPIYPKNLYLDHVPYTHEEYRREVTDKQIRMMHERDIWAAPDR